MNWRELWPAAVALAIAVIAVLAAPDSRARRVVDLDLSRSGFPDTFLMRHRSEPERCRVVDRHDSTMRRYDDKEPGRFWRCKRLEDARGDAWLVQSKREGRGTVFFVPADAVDDWAFPFLYAAVRASHESLDLPAVGWTQLYVDRVYEGLFLRVALPFDLRRKDGGTGRLRELLVVGDDGVRAVDTRLAPTSGWESSGGRRVSEPHPALAWLAARAPTDSLLLLVELDGSPGLLPLPIDPAGLAARDAGRPIAPFRDDRLSAFAAGLDRDADAATPFARAPLEAEFGRYASALREALAADAALHGRSDGWRDAFDGRQASLDGLALSLGGG